MSAMRTGSDIQMDQESAEYLQKYESDFQVIQTRVKKLI